MLRLATALLSPAGGGARLSAFIFHRVLHEPDPLMPDIPDASLFDRTLDWIGSQFRVLAPLDACERLYAGGLPARAAIVTFDDGYRDNHDVALPLLEKHGMAAAFFVATGFLGGGAMFNDRVIEAVRATRREALDLGWLGLGTVPLDSIDARRELIERVLPKVKHLPPAERSSAVERLEQACEACAGGELMMTEAQVRTMAARGMEIGGHTRGHPILRVLDDREAEAQIAGGADDLRAITGQRPVLFAYPNGRLGEDFEPRHGEIARAVGFRFAFTTHPGAASARSDPMQLPRFTPWDRSRARFKVRMLRNMLLEAA